MAIDDAPQFETVREGIAALLRAWKAELTELARSLLPQLVQSGDAKLELVVADVGLNANRVENGETRPLGAVLWGEVAVAELARVVTREADDTGRDAILRIDPGLVLRPEITLPATNRKDLRSALTFELERLTPIEASELYFDFSVTSREPETGLAHVTLRVVRRSTLDDAIRLCHAAGIAVAGIAFGGDAAPGEWRSFPLDRPAFARALWRRFGNLALLGIAGLLLLAIVVAGYGRAQAANDALDDQLNDAMLRAAVVERMEHRIETANAQISRLAQQRQGPLFVQTLDALSRLLPDGTWLSELHVEGNKIRADGYSKNASDLIGVLDKSPEFANTQFSAPLVRNPGDGTDRFQLTFEVKSARRAP